MKISGIYKQDALRNLAEKYCETETFDRIRQWNIDDIFYPQYKRYFKIGTNVVLNFNGKTTDGKSITSLKLVKIGNECFGRQMSEKMIMANQQEYANWVDANPNEQKIMLQVDEFSSLAETGENATVEMAYLNELSDIHAQMFVCRSYCSPTALPDRNTLLSFEVASKMKDEQFNVCYVYYNLQRNGVTNPQIIGHITVDVSDILKEDWYKKYRQKKFMKMKLLRDHGIYHERDLIYAKVIRHTIDDLYPFTVTGRKIERHEVKSTAKMICDQNKVRMTMIGIESVMIEPVKTVLDNMSLLHECEAKMKKLKIGTPEHEQMIEMRRNLAIKINYFKEQYKKREDLYEKYKKLEVEEPKLQTKPGVITI